MDIPTANFVRAGSLQELKAKGQLVIRGPHRPILVVYAHDRVFAFDNRCPHMGFPLERGSVEDGILTCHWHHARFDLVRDCQSNAHQVVPARSLTASDSSSLARSSASWPAGFGRMQVLQGSSR